jgi:hypothetical protein
VIKLPIEQKVFEQSEYVLHAKVVKAVFKQLVFMGKGPFRPYEYPVSEQTESVDFNPLAALRMLLSYVFELLLTALFML